MANDQISNFTFDGTTYDLTLPDTDKNAKFYNSQSTTNNVFTVEIPGITQLVDGMIIHVKFNNSTVSGATLNVNNLGAKRIYFRTATAITTHISVANNYVTLAYDEGNDHWVMQYAYIDGNTNTIGYQLRTNNSQWANKTGHSMNRYILLFEVDGGLSGAATTIGTGTTKTTIDFKYIPGGVIKYYTTNGAIANNALFAATGLWDQYTIDLRYTFNTGSTLTNNAPVYMRCVVNSDGTLTPDYSGSPSHPIAQTLPTTEDGKVYVYLGHAYSTTSIELYNNHPCYEFKNGKIQLWSGDRGSSTATGYWADQSISSTSSTSTTPTFAKATISPTSTTSGSALVINSSYSSPSIEFTGVSGNAGTVILTKPTGMSSSDSATVTLPKTTGVLALVDDIPTDYVKTGTNTYIKSASVSGDTLTLAYGNDTTVNFVNTTYDNKSAASGGTDLSLVTTGEKYTWNNKGTGTVTSVDSVSPSSGNVALSAVRYVSQSLTDTQKEQARTNIGALNKIPLEWNKSLSNGSNGKVCLGKFFMYDSNVTIEMSLTTSTTFKATLVIATQNMNRTTSPGSITANVYDDAENAITPLLSIFRPNPNTANGSVEVYANLPGWSKCLVHVRAIGLESKTETGHETASYAYDILTNVSSIPTTITGKTAVTSTNKLRATYYLASNPNEYTSVTSSTVSGWGFTKNAGTVTNVGAGTGLSISGTSSVNPTVNIASGYKLPTTTEWNSKADTSSVPTATSDLTNDSGFITSSSLPTNYVTTDTTQSISGTKTFSSANTYISGCGFSSSTNLGNNGYTAFMRSSSSNPLFGLKVGSTSYYLQATSSGLYLGPTSTVATSWTTDGSITIRGTTQPKWGTKTLATTDQIPTVTNYYWANVKVSSSSSTTTTPTFGQVMINPSSGAAKLTLKGASGYASGGITLQTPGTGDTTAYTLTLPAETSTLATQNYVSTAIANAITTALNTAV